MSDIANYEAKLQFVEELSLLMEENGKPRISGQILGWLMICDPPQQSFSDLVEHLQVSKASISNMTRLLLQSGLIEKVRMPGERQVYFQIKEGAWAEVLENQLELTDSMRELSAKGLNLIEDEPETDKNRLKEMNKFYTFASNRLPKLIAEYKEKHFE